MRYKTKPFEVEAVQWTGDNEDDVKVFARDDYPTFWTKDEWIGKWNWEDTSAAIYDKLHDTWVGVRTNDYIIKGMKGEFYPCNPEVFETKYESVHDGEERVEEAFNQLREASWYTGSNIRNLEPDGGEETD